MFCRVYLWYVMHGRRQSPSYMTILPGGSVGALTLRPNGRTREEREGKKLGEGKGRKEARDYRRKGKQVKERSWRRRRRSEGKRAVWKMKRRGRRIGMEGIGR